MDSVELSAASTASAMSHEPQHSKLLCKNVPGVPVSKIFGRRRSGPSRLILIKMFTGLSIVCKLGAIKLRTLVSRRLGR